MDRRGFLLGAGALALAGCARVPPAGVSGRATPSSGPAPLAVGSDGTLAGVLLAHLVAQALVTGGREAAVTAAEADWLASLGDGSLAAVPDYAATLWAELSDADEPPAARAVVTDVATLVAPEVSALAAEAVDGSLVWLVTPATAKAGITSLNRLTGWADGKAAAVPDLALSRADGVPGLKAVYGADLVPRTVADPAERAALVAGGTAAIGAFRRTEYTGVAGLVALDDPDQLGAPDPLVLLLHAGLADSEPDAVLALDELARALRTETLLDLQAKVAGGARPAEVARAWLGEAGVA